MIPVSRDEILSRFAGIPAVLWILHKLHPAITCKTFHPCWTGSLLCTAGIPLCRDEIFPCNHLSPPRRDKKVNYRRYFYCVFTTHMTSIYEKNSQENTYVGVSLRAFKSAMFSKRDSKADVFLWILRNFSEHLFWRTFANDCFLFYEKVLTQLKTKQLI